MQLNAQHARPGQWAHKRSSEVRGALTRVKDYELDVVKFSTMMQGSEIRVKLGNNMIEVVREFCYLSDVVGSSSDVQSLVTVIISAGWRKFSEMSHILCGRVLSLKLKGRCIYLV